MPFSAFYLSISVQKLTRNALCKPGCLHVWKEARAGSLRQQFQIPPWEWPNNSQYTVSIPGNHFSCISFLFPEENTSSLTHRNAVSQEVCSVKPCKDFKDVKPHQALRVITPFYRLANRIIFARWEPCSCRSWHERQIQNSHFPSAQSVYKPCCLSQKRNHTSQHLSSFVARSSLWYQYI